MSCKDCKYVYMQESYHEASNMAECRFNPPVVHIEKVTYGMKSVGIFPPVHQTQWCGKFEVKGTVN